MSSSYYWKADEGELQRWFAESTWFPTALLPSKYIHWELLDLNSAKAIVEDDTELIANLIFHFNKKGEIAQLTADRYRAVDNNSYSKINGLVITVTTQG